LRIPIKPPPIFHRANASADRSDELVAMPFEDGAKKIVQQRFLGSFAPVHSRSSHQVRDVFPNKPRHSYGGIGFDDEDEFHRLRPLRERRGVRMSYNRKGIKRAILTGSL
jgi:hypothetical protein